jgi:hypothetical protein
VAGAQCGTGHTFADYARGAKDQQPFEIEHIWATDGFAHQPNIPRQRFGELRNRLGALLLLPKDSNASFGDMPYATKLPTPPVPAPVCTARSSSDTPADRVAIATVPGPTDRFSAPFQPRFHPVSTPDATVLAPPMATGGASMATGYRRSLNKVTYAPIRPSAADEASGAVGRRKRGLEKVVYANALHTSVSEIDAVKVTVNPDRDPAVIAALNLRFNV